MTLRKLLPHILILISFSIVYTVSQTVPDESYSWLYESDSVWMKWGTIRLDFQRIVFAEVLPSALVLLNVYEIIVPYTDRFLRRILKNFLTILVSYLLNGFIYHTFIHNGVPNMYEYREGTPAFLHFFVAVVLTSVGLIVPELIRFIVLKKNHSRHVSKGKVIQP